MEDKDALKMSEYIEGIYEIMLKDRAQAFELETWTGNKIAVTITPSKENAEHFCSRAAD